MNRCFLILLLLLVQPISFAHGNRCPTDSKQAMGSFLTEVITWLNQLGSADEATLQQVRRYFNPNVDIQHNGRSIAKDYNSFVKSQLKARKFVIASNTQLPLEHFIMEDNQVAIHTLTTLNKRRRKSEQHQVMAIIEFDHCKITRWHEVSKKSRTG